MPYSFHFGWMNHRWVLGSADICFHKFLHRPWLNYFLTWFFVAGKTIPVTHGTGIYQEGLDFAVERLRRKEWINLYPEGQVNKDHGWRRLYWGIGRLVLESYPTVPIVLPFYHIGLDKVYPPVGPDKYKFKTNIPITVLIGQPMDLTDFVAELKATHDDELDIVQKITERLQDKLFEMRLSCEELHVQHLREKRPDQVEQFVAELVSQTAPEGKTQRFYDIYDKPEGS